MAGDSTANPDSPSPSAEDQPDWARTERVQHHIDADGLLQRGERPLKLVLRTVAEAKSGEVISVSSGFYPALIDLLRKAGHSVFFQSSGNRTFIRRS